MEELKKKYSEWEYEGEDEEQDDPEKNPDGTPKDPNAEDEDPAKKTEDELSDDEVIKVKIDGKVVEMTRAEVSAGYMRQSDYTRKTQELAAKMKDATPEEKKQVEEKAKEIVENPANFSADDVKTAEMLLKIVTGAGLAKKFGFVTREELDAEKAKEKQVSEFSSKIESAKSEVEKMKGMPAFDEEKTLNYMQESGIHDPFAAYLRMNDAQYRDFIIKQAKGDKSYKSDKGGKKIEPNEKEVDVRTEEGHRSFLSEELAKMRDK